MANLLRNHTVQELINFQRGLVQVPFSATVDDVIRSFLADDVLAYPISAPPGEFIGALGGGSTVIETDPKSGAARKQYIGIVSVLDVLMHIAARPDDLEFLLETPINHLIGHSSEGLSLKVVRPSTSLYNAAKILAREVHRVLVPGDPEHLGDIRPEPDDIVEVATNYHLLAQSDLISFLRDHKGELSTFMSKPIQESGVIHSGVFCVPTTMNAMDALRIMRNASIHAVAAVEAGSSSQDAEASLQDGKGRRITGTLSASDIRGFTAEIIRSLPSMTVLEFITNLSEAKYLGHSVPSLERVFSRRISGEQPPDGPSSSQGRPSLEPPVTLHPDASLSDVIELALSRRTHRVWITDNEERLLGVITYSDILDAARRWEHED